MAGDQGRDTAVPYPPYYLGTAGIDMNPLAGKSKLRRIFTKNAGGISMVLVPFRGKVNCDIIEKNRKNSFLAILIPLRGKVNCGVTDLEYDLPLKFRVGAIHELPLL